MTWRIYRWGLALAVALPVGWVAVDSSGAAAGRSYTAGNFGLQLDGAFAGFVRSQSGGTAVADVLEDAVGGGAPSKKRLGPVHYEDIEIEVGLAMSAPVVDWIAASWQGRAPRKSGTLVTYDYKFDAQQQTDFSGALLTETTIPACDAASKDAGYIALTIAPERTQPGKAAAGKPSSPVKGEQKLWIPSNFKLELDGLDTSRVSRVDAFTVKQKASRDSIGSERAASKEPTKLEFPNLKVTIALTDSDAWSKWHQDMVVAGGGEKQEKNGRLVFLAPNRQQELLEIKLHGVGIFALRSSKETASAEGVPRLVAELYCERMEFVAKGAPQ